MKVRELFLKHKAAELDREMGIIKTQEEAGRHVRMLTHEIRSTLDRHTILNTTLVELVKTLNLENCTIWMPNAEGNALELTHELERRLLQVFPCLLFLSLYLYSKFFCTLVREFVSLSWRLWRPWSLYNPNEIKTVCCLGRKAFMTLEIGCPFRQSDNISWV
jgi:hypothetical protein